MEYLLDRRTVGELVGHIWVDEEVGLAHSDACFRVDGEPFLRTYSKDADDKFTGPFPRLHNQVSRRALRLYNMVLEVGLEHLATDVETAHLNGTNHVIYPGLNPRVLKLRQDIFNVEQVKLDKHTCIGPGTWTEDGYKITWTRWM